MFKCVLGLRNNTEKTNKMAKEEFEKYTMSLDAVDVNLLPINSINYSKFDNVTPLWTRNIFYTRTNDYYEFEIKNPKLNDDQEDEMQNVLCHICNVDVPVPYLEQHHISFKHKINMKIADTAMERMKKSMHHHNYHNEDPNPTLHFCPECVTVIKIKNKTNHVKSIAHKNSLMINKFLNDFYLFYTNDCDNVNIDNDNDLKLNDQRLNLDDNVDSSLGLESFKSSIAALSDIDNGLVDTSCSDEVKTKNKKQTKIKSEDKIIDIMRKDANSISNVNNKAIIKDNGDIAQGVKTLSKDKDNNQIIREKNDDVSEVSKAIETNNKELNQNAVKKSNSIESLSFLGDDFLKNGANENSKTKKSKSKNKQKLVPTSKGNDEDSKSLDSISFFADNIILADVLKENGKKKKNNPETEGNSKMEEDKNSVGNLSPVTVEDRSKTNLDGVKKDNTKSKKIKTKNKKIALKDQNINNASTDSLSSYGDNSTIEDTSAEKSKHKKAKTITNQDTASLINDDYNKEKVKEIIQRVINNDANIKQINKPTVGTKIIESQQNQNELCEICNDDTNEDHSVCVFIMAELNGRFEMGEELYQEFSNLYYHIVIKCGIPYCMVCKVHFYGTMDVIKHLVSPSHDNNYKSLITEHFLTTDINVTTCRVCDVKFKRKLELIHCEGMKHIIKQEVYTKQLLNTPQSMKLKK